MRAMKRRTGIVAGAAVAASAVGAAAFAPLRALSWVSPGGSTDEVFDLAYGEGARQHVDVYAGKARTTRPAPAVVFFYGGAWQTGERAHYRFAGRALAAMGAVVMVPDYRLYPGVRYPGFLEDCATAVRWARDNAAKFGADPARLFLMGHSAGAYNAAMLALDARWLRPHGLDPARDLAGWIGLSGPYDFLPIVDPVVQTIFGPRVHWPATQPIAFATAAAPRALLLTGTADERVRPGNSERLAAKLRSLNVDVDLALYAECSHADTLIALSPLFAGRAPVLGAVETFLAR